MKDISITYLKAIGILLMVLAHTMCPFIMRQIIVMFHMPLFFFVSGYCLKTIYLNEKPFYYFILKKIKGLWWPFVKFSIIYLILHNLLFDMNIYNESYGYQGVGSIKYGLKDICGKLFGIIFYMSGNEQLLGGFWFLQALFYGSIISFIALKLIKRTELVLLILVILFIILNTAKITVPIFHLTARPFLAAIFFVIGFLFKSKKIKLFNNYYIIITLFFVFIGSFYWRTATVYDYYDNKIIFLYIITAILAIWSIYSLLKRINHSLYVHNILRNLFIYIGDNTLIILTLHFLSFKLVSFFLIKMYDLNIERLAEFPVIEEYSNKGWWILYFIIGIIVPIIYKIILSNIKRIYNKI